MSDVKFNLAVTGGGIVKSYQVNQTYTTLDGKNACFDGTLIDTDNFVTIPIKGVGTISKITVLSAEATLRIFDGATNTDILVGANGFFSWDIDATFAATIQTVSISTTSTTAIPVEVIIYGS